MFRYLLQNPAVEFKLQNSLALCQAALLGDVQLVKDLSSKCDRRDFTLSAAILGANLEIVKRETLLHPDIWTIGVAKTNPLKEIKGFLTMHYNMDLLKNADPYIVQDFIRSCGVTPDIDDLVYAAKSNNQEVVYFLINHLQIKPDMIPLDIISIINGEAFRIASELENESTLF